MNFDLDDDQRMIRDAIERFLGPIDIAARHRMRSGPGGYPAGRWQRLADLGLLALAAPEALGGLAGSRIDLALVAEAIGNGVAIDPWLEGGVLPVRLAAASGDEGLVAALISGAPRAALAFAEPRRRYLLEPHDVRADASGRISGTKTFVIGGADPALLLVTAAAPDGFGVYTVATDTEQVRRRDYVVADGGRAAEIAFHAAPATRLAIDFATFLDTIADTRFLAAAEMLGLAQRGFDETLAYVKQREQFGVPIGQFQALQHRLVDCYARIEQARSLVLATALDGASGPAWRAAAAGAKAMVGASALHVALEAVQMHGGMGQTDELVIGHALKRIMLLDRLFGDEATCLADFAKAA